MFAIDVLFFPSVHTSTDLNLKIIFLNHFFAHLALRPDDDLHQDHGRDGDRDRVKIRHGREDVRAEVEKRLKALSGGKAKEHVEAVLVVVLDRDRRRAVKVDDARDLRDRQRVVRRIQLKNREISNLRKKIKCLAGNRSF
jgi:hypothetical protein